MSNGLDPDQDQHSVSPDLGPNCLPRLPADDHTTFTLDQEPNTKLSVEPNDCFHCYCGLLFLLL